MITPKDQRPDPSPQGSTLEKGTKLFANATSFCAWFLIFAFLTLPMGSVALYSFTTMQQQMFHKVDDGHYDLSQFDLDKKLPIALNGIWYAYDQMYDHNPTFDGDLLTDPEKVKLPLSDFANAHGMRMYQGFLNYIPSTDPFNPTVLSLSFVSEDVTVYLNGQRLLPYDPMPSLLGNLNSSTHYNLADHFDPTLEYQEVLIATNKADGDTDLYGRLVRVSSHTNGQLFDRSLHLFELMFLGIAYCLMIIGFIFLIMRPQRSILSLVNLFDIVLLAYVIYGHTSISLYLGQLFDVLSLGDREILGASLFFLCMSMALGNDLIDMIFHCPRKIHPFFNHPLNIGHFILAFLFLLHPEQSSGPIYGIFLCWSTLTIGAVAWRMYNRSIGTGLTRYLKFQVVKTTYIMAVMLIDVLFLNHSSEIDTILLCYYYIFFIIHLFVRAYEYGLPEKQIAQINKNLEATIATRTAELTQANQVLRELTIRDALTKAHNRMYFETELDKAILALEEKTIQSLHLSLFDLDNFKQINDKFGHNVGDEQLIETMALAEQILPEDVIISRIGGEEFTFLFFNYTDETALDWVEKVRLALESLAQHPQRTTGSFGLSRYQDSMNQKRFFIAADQCLYYAKEQGKNCIAQDFRGEISLVSIEKNLK